MTGKGLFNQTGGAHPFSSSSSLCFIACKIFIVSIQCFFFLLLPHMLVAFGPSSLPIPSPHSYTDCLSSFWSPKPFSNCLAGFLLFRGQRTLRQGLPFLKYLHCSQHTTPLTLTPILLSPVSHKGALVSATIGWLINLLLQLGWSPETSVCGGSSLQGREDTQFWIEYSAPKRKVTHWA